MSESDIEFTVDLDISPAEQKFEKVKSDMKMADAVFERIVSQGSSHNSSASVNSQESIGVAASSLNNSAKKFEYAANAASLAAEKLKLQAERAAAKREYNAAFKTNDTSAMGTAAEKWSAADQNLKNISAIEKANKEQEKRQKELNDVELKDQEITGEAKAQNREMNEHHIKLGKTLTLLGLIKAAIEGIKKLWNGAFERQSELIKSTGFLTMDPIGTFHANTDRTYAMIMAGLKHLGAAAPFQMGAFNDFLTRIQTAKENAMMGKGVDDSLVIAFQQLSDILGTKLDAVQLLTGDPNRSNVEIAREILDTLEKQLPKLASMDEMTRSRLMGYIRAAIGPELANAIAANLNLNLRTGDTRTMVEKVESHGGSEITNVNVAAATSQITEAGAELRKSFDMLKDTITSLVSDDLADFANGLKNGIDAIRTISENPELFLPEPLAFLIKQMKEAKASKERAGIPTNPFQFLYGGAKTEGAKGLAKYGVAGAMDRLIFPDVADVDAFLEKNGAGLDKKINQLWSNPKSVADLLNAQIMTNSAYRSTAGGEFVEKKRQEAQMFSLWSHYEGGTLESFRGTDLEEIAKGLQLGPISKGLTFDKFKDAFKLTKLNKVLESLYEEGQTFDINSNEYADPYAFITKGLTPQDIAFYTRYWANRDLQRETTGGRATTDTIEIGGKVFARIQLTDINGKELKTQELSFPINAIKSSVSNK